MTNKASDLTGQWSGEFTYPLNQGPITPFLATVSDQSGQLSGTIIEPNVVDKGSLTAKIAGIRHGTSVDFTKSYAARSPQSYETPVDYVGAVSSDGDVIAGVWSLADMDGTFEMRRETAIDAHEEEQIAKAVTVGNNA